MQSDGAFAANRMAAGPHPRVKDGPRTIDLDLLLYGEVESQTEFLMLPHPRMHQRRLCWSLWWNRASRRAPYFEAHGGGVVGKFRGPSSVKRWCP